MTIVDESTNYMPVEVFKQEGYLQEANREFFHPLELELVVQVDENDKAIALSVIDNRKNPVGVGFSKEALRRNKRSKCLNCWILT